MLEDVTPFEITDLADSERASALPVNQCLALIDGTYKKALWYGYDHNVGYSFEFWSDPCWQEPVIK